MAHILLIEPDRLLGKKYQTALVAKGHQVTHCRSGQAAIQAADEQTPELVVVELQLQGHNGVEFLYEFRSYPEWQSVPVIAHSLVPLEALQPGNSFALLGIQSYLYKPATKLRQLIMNVDELLQPLPA